ncbi:DUF1648 domain-containing protein [Flavobacterium sp. GP15]|uniref:DUF1648 domain-containing protein n=1 Tax=Flavobacterium sp. GP15 TaxID=2758567 RepID=UPI001CB6B844|nr:DUF1648 domain-containing protein [Flavobacterium sp. GP15]
MVERIKIKLELTKVDMASEIISWVLIISIWILTITNYLNFPDIIATHYNDAVNADELVEKWIIFTLPLVMTVLFVGMSILNKFPHIYNYPINITKENAFTQYTNATRLIRYLKLIVVVVFGLIVLKAI